MATIIGTDGVDDLSSSTTGDVILGLGGDDTLQANAAGITLDGGSGSDFLGSSGGATLIGGAGDDIMISTGSNDTVSYANDPAGVTVDLLGGFAIDGTGGFDLLLGIANVTGSAFDDSLTGDIGNNVLQGGAGNDMLMGGTGNDIFKFSFDLTTGSGGGSSTTYTFAEWLAENYGIATDEDNHLPDYVPSDGHKSGKDDKHDKGEKHAKGEKHDKGEKHGSDHGHHHDGHAPSADTYLTQDFFSTHYTEWLNEVVVANLLEQGLVQDLNGNGKIDVALNQNDPYGTPSIEGLSAETLAGMFSDRDEVTLKTGKHAQERFYSNEFTLASGGGTTTTVTSGDGHDTISDFTWGVDQLEFNGLAGLAVDQFTSLFAVTEADVNNDGVADNTTLALADSSWDVTLVGISGHTAGDFYGSVIFA